MKKLFFVLPFLMFLGTYRSNAQDYKTGIGLRGGWTSGLTAKHFIRMERIPDHRLV